MSRGSMRAGPPPSTGGGRGGEDAGGGGAVWSRTAEGGLRLGLQPDEEEEEEKDEGRELGQGEEVRISRGAGAGPQWGVDEGSSRAGSACSSRR